MGLRLREPPLADEGALGADQGRLPVVEQAQDVLGRLRAGQAVRQAVTPAQSGAPGPGSSMGTSAGSRLRRRAAVMS